MILAVLFRLARALDGVPLLALGGLARLMPRRHASQGGVCHVIHSLGLGGGQRQFLAFARRAGQRDATFVSLTDTGGPFSASVDEVEVVQLYRVFRQNIVTHALAYLFPNTALTLALYWRLRLWRPRCVWGWLFLANVVAAPAARLAGVGRVIVRVENLSAWKRWPPHRRWWNRWADGNAARLADVVVVNAQALVEDFARWARVAREKIVVVHNGIDAEGWLTRPWRDRRSELGIAPGEVIVLTVGRLAREKNQELLLRACALLHGEGLPHHLVLVGDGELAAPLRQLAAELGLARWVHFVGASTTVQDFYRSADVFVLSSDIEGLANALLEAQVFGLPAVTTAAGGAGEVVLNGETGYVVGCGRADELAAALGRLVADRELRERLGLAGQERVRREFAIEGWARRIEELSLASETVVPTRDTRGRC